MHNLHVYVLLELLHVINVIYVIFSVYVIYDSIRCVVNSNYNNSDNNNI